MSFALEVKNELARIELEDNLAKARLSALVQLLSSMGLSSNGLSLLVTTTNANIIKRISLDIQTLYDIRAEISVVKRTNLSKNNIYTLTISDKTKEILTDLDLWTDRGLLDHPRLMFLNNNEMIKAYLAGCFMANGSVNSPTSANYHLEIKANSQQHGLFIIKLLEKFDIPAKMTTRRDSFVVYIKSSFFLVNFLALIGAMDATMEFESERINRDFYNNLTRLENVKIANEQKTIALADKQVASIMYLKEKGIMHLLSDGDRQVAELRLANPEASLNDLCVAYEAKYNKSLSKSGIRHRFEKIDALVKKYQERG